jgi:hypothetical protein
LSRSQRGHSAATRETGRQYQERLAARQLLNVIYLIQDTWEPWRATTMARQQDTGWPDRLIIETTQICREVLGSWNRTAQLCLLMFTIAVGLALLLWAT